MFKPPCSGEILRTPDQCSGSFEVTCPDADFGAGYTNQQSSTFTYSEDAHRRTGTLHYVVFDPDNVEVCDSTYDVTATLRGCD